MQAAGYLLVYTEIRTKYGRKGLMKMFSIWAKELDLKLLSRKSSKRTTRMTRIAGLVVTASCVPNQTGPLPERCEGRPDGWHDGREGGPNRLP